MDVQAPTSGPADALQAGPPDDPSPLHMYDMSAPTDMSDPADDHEAPAMYGPAALKHDHICPCAFYFPLRLRLAGTASPGGITIASLLQCAPFTFRSVCFSLALHLLEVSQSHRCINVWASLCSLWSATRLSLCCYTRSATSSLCYSTQSVLLYCVCAALLGPCYSTLCCST